MKQNFGKKKGKEIVSEIEDHQNNSYLVRGALFQQYRSTVENSDQLAFKKLSSADLSRGQKAAYLGVYFDRKDESPNFLKKYLLDQVGTEKDKIFKNEVDDYTRQFIQVLDYNENSESYPQELYNLWKGTDDSDDKFDAEVDPFFLICQILSKIDKWLTPSSVDKPYSIFNSEKRIMTEFSHAAMVTFTTGLAENYCSHQSHNKVRDRLFPSLKRSKSILDESSGREILDLSFDSKKKSTSQLFDEVQKNPEEFIKKIKKDPNYVSDKFQFNNSHRPFAILDVWGKILALQLNEYFRNKNHNFSSKEFNEQAVSILKSYLKNHASLVLGAEGSLMPYYTVAAVLLQLPEVDRDLLREFSKVYEKAEVRNGLKYFPYMNYSRLSFGEPETEDEKSLSESSPRSIVFMLALLKHERDPDKKLEYKEALLGYLENFSHNSSLHAMTFLRSSTHQGFGRAPYYFYPNLIYAMSAWRLLKEDPQFKVKADKLESMRSKFIKAIQLTMGKNGLIHKMSSSLYSNADIVNHSFALLALLPLIDQCDGKNVKKSYGVLELTPGYERLLPQYESRTKSFKAPSIRSHSFHRK